MNKRILICACDEKGGIAKEGKIPWDLPEDRKFFRQFLSEGNCVICGHKTYSDLTKIKNTECEYYPIGHFAGGFKKTEDAMFSAQMDLDFNKKEERGNIIVAGGVDIFNRLYKSCDMLFITHIKGDYFCNRFVDFNLEDRQKIVVFSCAEYERCLYF